MNMEYIIIGFLIGICLCLVAVKRGRKKAEENWLKELRKLEGDDQQAL